MTSGWIFLGIGTAIAVGDLVLAQVIGRRTGMPPMDGAPQVAPLVGIRMLRIGAVGIFLIFAALAFGVIPTAFIQPITLH